MKWIIIQYIQTESWFNNQMLLWRCSTNCANTSQLDGGHLVQLWIQLHLIIVRPLVIIQGRTPRTRTKSHFPWISPHFSVISQFPFSWSKVHWKFNPNKSNSNWMSFHQLFLLYNRYSVDPDYSNLRKLDNFFFPFRVWIIEVLFHDFHIIIFSSSLHVSIMLCDHVLSRVN